MSSEKRLTDALPFAGTLAPGDIIHIVDVDDASQNPAGSSFKLTLAQLATAIGAIGANPIMIGAEWRMISIGTGNASKLSFQHTSDGGATWTECLFATPV